MCRESGDLDLMLTFTFVNKWEEVSATEQSLRGLFNFPLDIRFCPLETLGRTDSTMRKRPISSSS